MAANPLVAGAVDTATPLSGAGLLDSGSQLASAIESGSWVEGGIAAFSVALDTAATVSDPLGSLIAAGLGWLIDHFEPLKGWFNDLTGDAGEVAGFAQTWSNVSTALTGNGDDLVRVVADLDDLQGLAFDAYRRFQTDAGKHLHGAAQWSSAMSTGLTVASQIVQVVHDLVRDVLSQLIGSAISWAAEAVFSLGLATPWIVEQISTRVASWVAKIGGKLTSLLKSVKSLAGLLDKLKALLKDADDLFDSVLRRGTPHAPDGPHPLLDTSPVKKPRPQNDPYDHLGPDVIDDSIPGAHNVPGDYSPTGGMNTEDFIERYWDRESIQYDDSQGGWRYPGDDGFDTRPGAPAPREVDMPVGATFDRYGEPYGRYTSPTETPFPDRAIPPDSLGKPYSTYEVVRPFDEDSGVPRAGRIAPWFGQPGGGIQYHLPRSVQWLLDNGYIQEVAG